MSEFRGLTAGDEEQAFSRTGRGSNRAGQQSVVSYALGWIWSYVALIGTAIMAFFEKLLQFAHRVSPQPAIRINNRSFQVVKPLGEGGFSFVYLVKESADSALYALKRVRLQLPEQVERFKGEVEAMKGVDSPHVMKIVDSAVLNGRDGNPLEGLIVMPFYSNGTVQDLIDRTPLSEFIPLKLILQYSVDICAGLLAFHKKDPPQAFRDLKPANVLIDDQDRAVLMDLGSVAPARVRIASRRDAVALQDIAAESVTAPFRAPELFDPPTGVTVDERSDIWALGCTIFAMAYRTSPFDGTMTAAVGGRIPFPSKPDPYGNEFRTLLQLMIVTDFKQRPSIEQVLTRIQSLQSLEASHVV